MTTNEVGGCSRRKRCRVRWRIVTQESPAVRVAVLGSAGVIEFSAKIDLSVYRLYNNIYFEFSATTNFSFCILVTPYYYTYQFEI